jgi:hypothetical protein
MRGDGGHGRWHGTADRLLGASSAAAAVLALAVLAGACGPVPAPGTRVSPATPERGTAGVSAGSRAQALALAERMLSHLVLPPGARLGPMTRPLAPPGLAGQAPTGTPAAGQAAAGTPAGTPVAGTPAAGSPATGQPVSGPSVAAAGTVSVSRSLVARQPVPAMMRFLLAHPPAGLRVSGSGQGDSGCLTPLPSRPPTLRPRRPVCHQIPAVLVSYAPRALPPGIYQAELAVALAPGRGGGSQGSATAQVTWYPPRSPAEHIDPARVRTVTVSARLLNPRIRTVKRSFTSRAVIARLAGILNRLPALPAGEVLSCPAILATYRAVFAGPGAHPGQVVATADGCLSVGMSVNGHPQPELRDNGALAAAIRGLLGLQPVG